MVHLTKKVEWCCAYVETCERISKWPWCKPQVLINLQTAVACLIMPQQSPGAPYCHIACFYLIVAAYKEVRSSLHALVYYISN